MAKVFVFGMDGATFDIILPMVEKGKLPNFAQMIKDGSWCPLDSVPSMRSPAAWSTFITGMNPGKHGLFEFYEPISDSYQVRFVHGGMRKGKSFWQILSDAGKRVGIINVPMTYPAERVNGFVIAGLDAPGVDSRGFCYPQDLRDEIKKEFGDYIIEPGLTGCIVKGRPDLGVDKLHEELQQKEKVAEYLMDRHPWDCFVVVFRSLDAVQHCYWKYMDPQHPQYNPEEAVKYGSVIEDAYVQLDKSLGRFRSKLDDDTTLMIMSDHGFGRKHAATCHLNHWLKSKGLLKFNNSNSQQSSFFGGLLKSTYRMIIANTSRSTKEKLVRWFPALRNKVQSQMVYANIDWEQTQVFADGLFAALRLNVQGREPNGVVAPGKEYDELVHLLKSELEECRDSVTGNKIVDRVWHRNELYSGNEIHKAPDLLVRWREDEVIHGIAIEGDPAEQIDKVTIPGEDPNIISGDHKFHGVLLMAGNAIQPSKRLDQAGLVDLAPTILKLFGMPIPDDMDGDVLVNAIDEQALAQNEGDQPETVQAVADDQVGYSEEDQEVIAERLRDLGYIE